MRSLIPRPSTHCSLHVNPVVLLLHASDNLNNHDIAIVSNLPGTTHAFFSCSVNARGDLYTFSNRRLWVLRASTLWLEWYAGVHSGQLRDGNRYEAVFGDYSKLEANDDHGRIWTTSRTTHAIRMIFGSDIVTVAGRIGEKGYRDGPSHFARFDQPDGITRLYSQRALLIAEASPRFRLLDLRTHHVSTLKIDGSSILHNGSLHNCKLSSTWTAGYPPPQGTTKEFVRAVGETKDDKSAFTIDLAKLKGLPQSRNNGASALPAGHFFPHSVYIAASPFGCSAITTINTGDEKELEASFQMLGDTKAERMPVFIPQTNVLVSWSHEHGLLLVWKKYLQPAPPPPTIPQPLAKNWSKRLSEPIDFSSLIGSPIIGDVPFEFKQSGRIINLHSRVLKINKGLKKNLNTILRALENSTLPEASIEALIGYLYFKRITIDSTTDLKHLGIQLAHVAWLCKELSIEASRVLFDFHTLILPRISNDVLIACLIECWSSSVNRWRTRFPSRISLPNERFH